MVNYRSLIPLLLVLFVILICAGCNGASQQAEIPEESSAPDQIPDEQSSVPAERPSTKDMIAAAEEAQPIAEDAGTVGSAVYDFQLSTYDGGTFTTDDLQGKVTMLIFWFPT